MLLQSSQAGDNWQVKKEPKSANHLMNLCIQKDGSGLAVLTVQSIVCHDNHNFFRFYGSLPWRLAKRFRSKIKVCLVAIKETFQLIYH